MNYEVSIMKGKKAGTKAEGTEAQREKINPIPAALTHPLGLPLSPARRERPNTIAP